MASDKRRDPKDAWQQDEASLAHAEWLVRNDYPILRMGYPMIFGEWYEIPGTGLEAYADLLTKFQHIYVRTKRGER